MAWLRKNPDPISDRARVLNDEIARLESKIRKLDAQLQQNHSSPRLRSTALPKAPGSPHSGATNSTGHSPTAAVPEPVFEEIDRGRLEPRAEGASTPAHYNDLGVRKYDLPALFQRLRNQFRGPSTTNPKLVSYLAAGGIQGLRPMRYEKRVARRRFIALVALLFLALLGIILAVARR